MSRLIPPAPEGLPAELTITLPADDIAVIHGMLAADGKQMIQSGVSRAVAYGENLWRIARAIDHQANAQMPGSADPSSCPPLAPGDDETCTHTPACPTGSAEWESDTP